MKKGRSRTLQSAKYLQKKRKRLLKNLSLGVAGAIALIALLIFIFTLEPLQISTINVTGTKTLSVEEIRSAVNATLQGKYLNIIPKTSGLFFSEEKTRQELLNSFKKIHSVEFDHKDLDTLNISITESIPQAIVCEGFREDERWDDCFYVDEKGYIFEKSSQFSDGVYLKYFVNMDSDPLTIGTSFMDEVKFKELQSFAKKFNDAEISVTGILVGALGSYELYIRNSDQSVTVIYFDDVNPLDKTFSNFIAFWQSAKDNKLGERTGTSTAPVFDYINLRFGNNIFYTTK